MFAAALCNFRTPTERVMQPINEMKIYSNSLKNSRAPPQCASTSGGPFFSRCMRQHTEDQPLQFSSFTKQHTGNHVQDQPALNFLQHPSLTMQAMISLGINF